MRKPHHGKYIEKLAGVKVEEGVNEWENLFLLWGDAGVEADQELKYLKTQTHKKKLNIIHVSKRVIKEALLTLPLFFGMSENASTKRLPKNERKERDT